MPIPLRIPPPTNTIPLSLLDLAVIRPTETAATTLAGTVELAQAAEALGYHRVWYAEHHNMPAIASSTPAVLIAHVGAHTKSIRLGSGGVMLPNHSPLVVAEQFGLLESLHPGRIDLGLGRAPGTDRNTMLALRSDARSAERFPDDVRELQAYLRGETRVPGVNATPGAGTQVPLYILGSSLFGATLAAAFGLPYAFASQFAPAALNQAVATYRREFRPSKELEQPHVIAGVNVIAADTQEEAREHHRVHQRFMAMALFARDLSLSPDQVDALMESPAGSHLRDMQRYTAVGTADDARAFIRDFASQANVDEVMVAHQSPTQAARLKSMHLLAEAGPISRGPVSQPMA